jgi:hypothetical protein
MRITKKMKIFILFLFVFIQTVTFAQTELTTAFNTTASGRNVSLTWSKTNNKHELGAGFRYNIGMIAMSDDQGNLYYKRLYPSTFEQHFGLQTFYNYHILKNWEHLNPFLFFDLQGTFSTSRNTYPGQSEARRYGPFTWLEQYIGFGYKVDLPKNFFITQKIGAGGMLIFGSDKTLLKEKAAWEFGGILNVGIGYRFK